MIRLVAPLGVLGTLLLPGCSTPQHSNVLIFGTNTRLALDVTYDPKTQEPDILFGYKRQEAVWMPLLANLSNAKEDAQRAPTAADLAANEKLLYIGKDDKKVDTYSVLASFGAQFEAKAKTELTTADGATTGAKPEASSSGGLAQFFATGLAARILAEKGGESLVSVQKTTAPANARAAEANADKAKAETEKAQIEADFGKYLDTQREKGRDATTEAVSLIASRPDDKLPELGKAAIEAGLITEAKFSAATKPEEQRKLLVKYAHVGNGPEVQALAKFLEAVR